MRKMLKDEDDQLVKEEFFLLGKDQKVLMAQLLKEINALYELK